MARKKTETKPITESSVLDIGAYTDDFVKLDEQSDLVEDLYEELHNKVIAASDGAGKAGVLGGIKSHSINSQAYEVLMKIRTSSIDLVGKKINLKLSLATLAQKNKAAAEDAGGDQAALAREVIRQLQQEEHIKTIREKIGKNDYEQKSSKSSMDALENRVTEEFDKGGIVLTPNEKAMKYTKVMNSGGFSYVYDDESDKIRVKLSNGDLIPEDEWPEERLPQAKIIDHTETHVILENGQKLAKL